MGFIPTTLIMLKVDNEQLFCPSDQEAVTLYTPLFAGAISVILVADKVEVNPEGPLQDQLGAMGLVVAVKLAVWCWQMLFGSVRVIGEVATTETLVTAVDVQTRVMPCTA